MGDAEMHKLGGVGCLARDALHVTWADLGVIVCGLF